MDEITRTADDVKEEPVTLNYSIADNSNDLKDVIDDTSDYDKPKAESTDEKPVAVNSSSHKKVDRDSDPRKKMHHANVEESGPKYDDDAALNMMMMQHSISCERNLWTATCVVLTNLYPQFSHSNLCFILLWCFALLSADNVPILWNLRLHSPHTSTSIISIALY